MRKIHFETLLLALLLSVTSCFKDSDFDSAFPEVDSGGLSMPERVSTEATRRVMILVSAGYNNLSESLKEDLADLEQGYLPRGKAFNADVLLVLSRQTRSYGDYTTGSSPVLYQLYSDMSGAVRRDTLLRWSESTQLCTKETLGEALSFVQDKFLAQGYGMIFSSHGSGWLPKSINLSDSSPLLEKKSVKVYSLGQDKVGVSGSVSLDLDEFVEAIPMHLDYLLMDACYNGCVEVAWALRDKADVVGFSPTEVMEDGYDYLNITSHLLAPVPDPVAVCRDFFSYYDSKSGKIQSATTTVVVPRQMDSLATVCRSLFEKYRTAIDTLDGKQVQGYFRKDYRSRQYRFLYDLKDILVQAGITPEEEERLDRALEDCILYKEATPYFFKGGDGGFPINRYCGLSMYLPSVGTDELDEFYRENIAWNRETHLVE